MERTYKIRMNVPLGSRDGTLTFIIDKNQKINGVMKLFEKKTPFSGKLTSDGDISFAGKLITLTRSFEYEAQGKICGTKIQFTINGEHDSFAVLGEEAEP